MTTTPTRESTRKAAIRRVNEARAFATRASGRARSFLGSSPNARGVVGIADRFGLG
jgi:hypothetical protein